MDSKKPHDAAILSELGRWDGGRRGTSTKVRFDGFPDAAASTRLFFSTGSSDPSIATFPMRLAARSAPLHSNNPKRSALNPPFGVVFVVPPHRKRCGAAQRMLFRTPPSTRARGEVEERHEEAFPGGRRRPVALEEEAAWGTATSSSVMAAMKRTATDMVGSADGKVRPPPPAGPAPSGESTFINQKLKPVGAPDGSRCWEDFYEMQAQVGEGMYGQVYKMKEKSSNETVALKKVRMANEKEGFPITAIREIKLLSKFADPSERRHPASGENIVRLKEIVNSKADADNDNKGDIFMVLEYMAGSARRRI